MTKQELMEQVWQRDPRCSAGDIALALSKRWPRGQGDGPKRECHFTMANKFLKSKKELIHAKVAQHKALNEFVFATKRFSEVVAKAFHYHGLQWQCHLPKREQTINSLGNAFETIGL